jgi:hypothetical protein
LRWPVSGPVDDVGMSRVRKPLGLYRKILIKSNLGLYVSSRQNAFLVGPKRCNKLLSKLPNAGLRQTLDSVDRGICDSLRRKKNCRIDESSFLPELILVENETTHRFFWQNSIRQMISADKNTEPESPESS